MGDRPDALTHAYRILDRVAAASGSEFPPLVMHRIDQEGAHGRDLLASYGIDLDDGRQRDAVVAVLDVLASAHYESGDRGLLLAVSSLISAVLAWSSAARR